MDWKKSLGLWFGLTDEERKLVLGIVALALIGLVARYVHLKRQGQAPLPAEIMEEIEQAKDPVSPNR